MDLIFAETTNRRQCGSETVVEGFKVQCSFSSSKIVTIPKGLHYFDGKLDFSESMPGSTISICRNHEMRLKTAFRELYGKEPVKSISESSDSAATARNDLTQKENENEKT
jgi:hypothetical protein